VSNKPKRNLTFAHAAEKAGEGDSCRSRMQTDDWHTLGAERLHPTTMNWRSRPKADVAAADRAATNVPFDEELLQFQRRRVEFRLTSPARLRARWSGPARRFVPCVQASLTSR
jgi:hypothetical protein